MSIWFGLEKKYFRDVEGGGDCTLSRFSSEKGSWKYGGWTGCVAGAKEVQKGDGAVVKRRKASEVWEWV